MLMNGVEILSTTIENVTQPSQYITLVIATWVSLVVIYTIYIKKRYGAKEGWRFQVFMFGIITLFVAVIIYINLPNQIISTYNVYQGTISDNVSYNEFTSKYEVLEVNGKMYTFKERIEE